ncbi:11220_t:CDS:2, partial [Paraglomus brasilianum]
MKFQSIIVFIIVSLAFGSHVQALCEIFLKGTYKHQTGGQSGCFGADFNDPISVASVSIPRTSYKFYSGYNCKGSILATGIDTTNFDPRIQF